MPLISISSAPAIFAAVAAGLDRHERIIGAVNNNRGRLDPFERRTAIAAYQRSSHLSGKARRIVRSLEFFGRAPA